MPYTISPGDLEASENAGFSLFNQLEINTFFPITLFGEISGRNDPQASGDVGKPNPYRIAADGVTRVTTTFLP